MKRCSQFWSRRPRGLEQGRHETAPSMKKVHDIIVVGGGIVGACIARTARARTGASVVLLDKSSSSCLPEHGSARNSGVMHAGFYYTGDSLKAKLTRKGNVFLHHYCQERGIPVNE